MGWVYTDLKLPIPPSHSPLHSPHLQCRKGQPSSTRWVYSSFLHAAPARSPLAGLVGERSGSPVDRSGYHRRQRQTLALLLRWGGWYYCKLLPYLENMLSGAEGDQHLNVMIIPREK